MSPYYARLNSYSQLIAWPIQVVTMIILTLVLARKRLHLGKA
jgi:hypothetical protein